MSNSIQDYLVKHLLPHYNKESHSFSPQIQEEFLECVGGFLDKTYIATLAESTTSSKAFKSLCLEVFGADYFTRLPLPDRTLSRSMFKKEYEFGKYVHARQWVSHFNQFAPRAIILSWVYASYTNYLVHDSKQVSK